MGAMPGPNAVTKTNFVPKALPKPLTIDAMWSSAAVGNSAKRVVAGDGGQEQGQQARMLSLRIFRLFSAVAAS